MGNAAHHGDERDGGTVDERQFTAEQDGRLDAIIAAEYADLSRARAQRLITSGTVTVNGAPARKSSSVSPGDAIVVRIVLRDVEAVASAATVPELDIIYEDDALLVINKPAGLAVHGAPGDTGPLVVAWFVARYPEAARHFDVERPGIVHRLDKETSGVLLMAKTPQAQTAASAAFAARTVEKTYLAIAEGPLRQRRAVIEAAIGRDPRERTRMAVTRAGRHAVTRYRTIASDGEQHLLEVGLETGRTHQIRVHLAAVGLPVVGDAVYGNSDDRGRHLLHAWRLSLPHPSGGVLTVAVPPPDDITEAIAALGGTEAATEYLAPAAATLDMDATIETTASDDAMIDDETEEDA